MNRNHILPFIAALALLLPAAAEAVAPRDTVYVSDRSTTHVLMSVNIESAEPDVDSLLTITLSDVRQSMMALQARKPFEGIVTLTVEDPTGAFRLVAAAYDRDPENLLVDLRAGGTMNRKREGMPVIEVTQKKAMHVRFPGRITYADKGAAGILDTEVMGAGKDDLTIKAAKAFTDSTNITLCDSTGALHMYLVKYRKSLRTSSMKVEAEEGAEACKEKPLEAPRAAVRDTVTASEWYAAYVIAQVPLRGVAVPEGSAVSVETVRDHPDMLVIRTGGPFGGAVPVMTEDSTGAYRYFAVTYAAKPERLVTDLRKDTMMNRRLNGALVVNATTRKNTLVKFPERITYADFGSEEKISAFVTGPRKNEISLKATAAFADSTSVMLMDADGNLHTFLVRYKKSLKRQEEELDLRTKTAGTKSAEPQKKQEEPVRKPVPEKKDEPVRPTKITAGSNDDIFVSAIALPAPAAKEDTAKREAAPLPQRRRGNGDTVYVSNLYTTHLIFSTDLGYADLSNPSAIAAKIVDQSKNKLAIKARGPFDGTANVSMEEANGEFHTFIVAFREEPGELIVDCRTGAPVHPTDSLRVIGVSDKYTTHLIFATDISYADLSRPSALTGKLVDQGRNKLALTARTPFRGRANVSVEEANGMFHTYLLEYAEEPPRLVVDTKSDVSESSRMGGLVSDSREKVAGLRSAGSVSANVLKKRDAPLLSDVINKRQTLWHTGVRKHKLTLMCENIFSYSDITYLVLSLDNASGISYEAEDVMFVIETTQGIKRKVLQELNVYPKNRFGSLTVPAKGLGRMAFSFDKITMSEGQVMKVYLYENGGNRHLVLTLSAKDVNGAISPYDVK